MNETHPKALAAKAKAELRRNIKNAEHEQIKLLLSKYKLRTLHVGEYTFCYRTRVGGRNVIELSSTLRNPSDRMCTHTGKLHAISRFMLGNRIMLRNDLNMSHKNFLRTHFGVF